MNDYLRDRVTVAVGAHYLIENEIGRGGMAVVYRATDPRLHRTVAIKVLPPDLAFNANVRTRFIREAQTAAQLNHPNIVPIYTVEEKNDADGLVYFVMSFIDGESVGARLAREGAWPVEETVRVLREVADALAYAHARGVVHRDIKPDNILLDRASGRPMVTDFGIARAAAGEVRLTQTGVAVGTPAYMSPEQALGERELDGRSDLYSLAVVGYHMLAGDTPFVAKNTPAMLIKHVSERPRPIRDRRPEIPAYLAVAIDRALAKRPEDRWSDAAEFRDALAGAQASAPHTRRPPEPQPPVTPSIAPSPQLIPFAPAPSFPLSSPLVPATPAAPVAGEYGRASSATPPFPLPPPGLSRKELKHWYRTQQELMIRVGAMNMAATNLQSLARGSKYDDRPLEERVIAFRRSAVSLVVLTPMLAAVNAAMNVPPWFFVPAGLLLLNALRKGGSIWSDGVGPIDAFRKGIRAKLRAEHGPPARPYQFPSDAPAAAAPAPPPRSAEQLAAELVPADVLTGPHGDIVRRAAVDRRMMREILIALRPIEREMIPDVTPTVDALAERVGALATTLHRLDADVSGASLGALDQRIAALATETA
ncbi:MAG TPA: serine/threonine-protein kinase, partial [Gemmatimonadaceae bacterium]|nr:serine/threonine-protein kinase [Gemmatimonadaceae bacterium]